MKRVKKIWLIGIWTMISVFSYHSFDTSENYLRSEDSHTKKESKALFEIKQKNKDAQDALKKSQSESENDSTTKSSSDDSDE